MQSLVSCPLYERGFLKMNRFLFMIIFILPISLWAKSYDYQLSICAIFKNEAAYLKEWIEFHKLVGVQHFYLYNNESSDASAAVLLPYIQSGEVELRDWNCDFDDSVQEAAYSDCLKRCIGKTKWLAVIDIDEFLFPVKEDNLVEFLNNYTKFGGVSCYWQVFGTSGLKAIPKGRLVTESFTRCLAAQHDDNRFVKTIVRPETVQTLHIHIPDYKPPFFGVDSTKTRFPGSGRRKVLLNKIRINHYWTRAEDFFFGQKIPKIRKHWKRPIPEARIKKWLVETNQEEDFSISRFLPRLRAKVTGEEISFD